MTSLAILKGKLDSNYLERKDIFFIIFTILLSIAIVIFSSLENVRGILFFFILFFVILIIAKNLSIRFSEPRLLTIIIVAFLFRSIIAYITSTIFPLGKVYMADANMYHIQMRELAESFFTFRTPYLQTHNLKVLSYSYLGSFLYFIFGPSILIMKFLNAFFGVLLIVNVYRILSIISNKRSALLGSVLVSFWPSIAFWNSQNLRDSLMVLLISEVTYLYVKAKWTKRNINFLYLLIPLAGTLILRLYIGIIITAIFFIFITIRLFSIKGYIRPLGIFAELIFFAVLIDIFIKFEPTLIAIFNGIRSYMATGGSAFFANAQYNNFCDVLTFIPKGLFYFLFAPLIGMTKNLMQFFSSIENLGFYFIFVSSILGLLYFLRERKIRLIAFPLCVIISIAVIYSLIEGNVGTAYRHKMQILPFIIMFSAHFLGTLRIKSKT